MDLSAPGKKIARFGLFEADLQECVLIKSGLRVRLQDQPFQVLAVLLERPGEVVSREDIRQKLWSADTFVEFDDGLNNAIKKLRVALGDSADNPRFIETVPRRGYRFLAPVDFPASPDAPDLTKPTETVPENIVIAARERSRVVIEHSRPRSLTLLWVGAVLVLTLVVGGYFYRARHRSNPRTQEIDTTTATLAIRRRPSVAVMGFRNLSGRPESAWLSPALAEMLNTELAAGEKLRLVPSEQISRAKLDLTVPDTETLAKESLAHLHMNLDADYIVLGSYMAIGERDKTRIRLDLRLQDAKAGETIAEEAVTGQEGDLFELVAEAGSRLRQKLGAGGISNEEGVRARASMPSNLTAARLYTEGLSKLNVFDALSARNLLKQAVEADPKYPMAHAALASAWSSLGYDAKAQQEAKQAFDLAGSLSEEERLAVEGSYRQTTHDWPRAVEIYRSLWTSFPDVLDYGLQLASVQTLAGKGKDALTTVESLRKPPPTGADPRIDLAEEIAAESLGDFKRCQQVAAVAATKARNQGARLLLADARSREGWAWERLGHPDEALTALEEARALFITGGNRRGAARATTLIGDTLDDKGDFEGARTAMETAVGMCRELAAQTCTGRALSSLGNLMDNLGKPKEAGAYYEQALRIYNEVESRAGSATILSNLANVHDSLGDLAGSVKLHQDAQLIFNQLGDKQRAGSNLSDLGFVLEEQGDPVGAARTFEQALAVDRETGYRRGVGIVLTGLGGVLAEQDKLVDARKALEEALSIRQSLGNPEGLAICWMASASLALDENHPAEAEKMARDAAHQFESSHEENPEAAAYALLARSLLAQGKMPEAQAAGAHALSASQHIATRPPRFDAMIAHAMTLAATGNSEGARKMLNAVLTEARAFGYVTYKLQARWEASVIEMKTNPTPATWPRLAALEKEARARGFVLIARKALAAAANIQKSN